MTQKKGNGSATATAKARHEVKSNLQTSSSAPAERGKTGGKSNG